MKIVSFSDIHGKHNQLDLPPGDVLIFAGDYEQHTDPQMFLEWFGRQDYEHKILVAGNHDSYLANIGYEKAFALGKRLGYIYLEDTSITIGGITFHGSPWCNNFGYWDFMGSEDELYHKWERIDPKTNVLITHGPAYGTGDLVTHSYGEDPHVGSKTLQVKLFALPELKYHLSGHIHESYGEYKHSNYISSNISSLNIHYKLVNPPYVFTI